VHNLLKNVCAIKKSFVIKVDDSVVSFVGEVDVVVVCSFSLSIVFAKSDLIF